MSDIGKVIRALRQREGMTLADLAHQAGTDPGNIPRLETGKQGYTEKSLQAIASAFGLDIVDLWMLASLKPDELVLLHTYRKMASEKQEALLKFIDVDEDERSGRKTQDR